MKSKTNSVFFSGIHDDITTTSSSDYKDLVPTSLSHDISQTGENSSHLLAPTSSSKAPGLAVIKERSFESQISPGSSSASLHRDPGCAEVPKIYQVPGDNAIDWNFKSVLPLIDGDDMPYHYYQNIGGEINRAGDIPPKVYNINPQQRELDYIDKSDVPHPGIKNLPKKEKSLAKIVSSQKERKKREKGKKANMFVKNDHQSNEFDQEDPSSSYSSPGRSDPRRMLPDITPPATGPLFDIDDAIDGTSDAIRNLLHTSDAIDDVMKHTTDDIEKELE